jgi:spermidine synthase
MPLPMPPSKTLPRSTTKRPPLLKVAVLLFLSGVCALAYQVAWMRSLRLVFGASTAASAAVLAIFMAGLGVGNAVLGPFADRKTRPLRFYGQLEILIALIAGVSPLLVLAIEWSYVQLGGQNALGLTGATIVRLLLSAMVLGGPTFLMGGTLPAAARAVTTGNDEGRSSLAWLYGVNTLGAVFGATVTTFLLLEHLGTWRTLWAASVLNLLVGLLAVRWGNVPSLMELTESAKPARAHARTSSKRAPSRVLEEVSDRGDNRPLLIYAASAVLGCAFFLMELVWYRMLGPLLGGTTFTFGIILAVALVGIGTGGLLYAMAFRRLRPTWGQLALTCGLEAAAIGVPFALGDWVAIFAGRMAELGSVGFIALSGSWFVIAMIVVFPAAVISGVQFPLLIALLGRGSTDLGKQIGYAYAWNTGGAILGSLAGGFGALPLLSATGAWVAVVWLLAAVASGSLAVSATSPPRPRWTRLIPTIAAIAIAITCTFALGPTAVWRHTAIGAGRANLPATTNQLRNWMHDSRNSIVWEADGVESAIGISVSDGISFIVNGKADGNAAWDAGTQVGLAIVGAMLHADPQTACVIGLGTGETVGWLADMRNMKRVDVVELEPRVDEMARRSRDYNRGVLTNPRIRRIYNDAREELLVADGSYDLILSEPSNPYRAGVAALYTREFYQSVQRRLNRDGLFLQWLQGYEIDMHSAVMVISTLRSVFANVELWRTQSRDSLLVCSNEPLALDSSDLRTRMENETLKQAMKNAWQTVEIEGFLARFVARKEFLDALIESSKLPLNTDVHNRLEFGFAKTVGRRTGFSLGELRSAAAANQLHRPSIAEETVDWNRVALHRVALCVLSGEQELELQVPAAVPAVGRGLELFARSEFSSARKELQAAASELELPELIRLFLLTCGAELGDASISDEIAKVEVTWPVEAAAIRTVLAARISPAEGDRAYEHLHKLLKSTPWNVSQIVERALAVEYAAALLDPVRARRLFDLLAEPYCGLRFEEDRKAERFRLAKLLGPEAIVEALAPYEPYIPWDEDVLTARATAYFRISHPLAKRAAADLKLFQRIAREH